MLPIADNDIGGARVRRTFTRNGEQLKGGHQLTADEVLSIAYQNRQALIDSNFIEVYPKAMTIEDSERFIVGIGKDKYNVIAGRVLNESPLTRDQAEKLLRNKN